MPNSANDTQVQQAAELKRAALEYHEFPTPGKLAVQAIDVMGADVVRFVDGKVAEHWGYMEEMKMMGQLGLWPPAPAAAPKSMKK